MVLSHSSMGFLSCGGPRIRKPVALSSAEAEHVAVSEAVKKVPFVVQVL